MDILAAPRPSIPGNRVMAWYDGGHNTSAPEYPPIPEAAQ